jgi:Uma2 family endonuclease
MTRAQSYHQIMAEPLSSTELLTAEDLLRLNLPDKQVELVRGRLIVREPPGYGHGYVAFAIAARIAEFARANGLGVVLAAETGFQLFSNPDTVRAGDAAFIRRERVPDPPPTGYARMAPDLALEVLSPGDGAGEVLQKVGDWLSAGSQIVWVVDPVRRRARVYRADGSESLLNEPDALDGEDILPGFSCPLAEILPR